MHMVYAYYSQVGLLLNICNVLEALIEVKEESRDFFNVINSLDEEERMRRRKKIKEVEIFCFSIFLFMCAFA